MVEKEGRGERGRENEWKEKGFRERRREREEAESQESQIGQGRIGEEEKKWGRERRGREEAERWERREREGRREGFFQTSPNFVMAGTSTTLSGARLACNPHGHAIDARLFSASFNEIFDTLFRN